MMPCKLKVLSCNMRYENHKYNTSNSSEIKCMFFSERQEAGGVLGYTPPQNCIDMLLDVW